VASIGIGAVANINDAPTGAVTITGATKQGATLTATNNLADPMVWERIGYQWKVDGRRYRWCATDEYPCSDRRQVGKAFRYCHLPRRVWYGESVSSSAVSPVAIVNHAPSFSSVADGKVATVVGSSNFAYSVTLQADCKNSLGGASLVSGNTGLCIGALQHRWQFGTAASMATERLTTHFGIVGMQPNSVTVQGDGKILVCGLYVQTGSNNDISLARYNADGTLDASFDNDGKVTTSF